MKRFLFLILLGTLLMSCSLNRETSYTDYKTGYACECCKDKNEVKPA